MGEKRNPFCPHKRRNCCSKIANEKQAVLFYESLSESIGDGIAFYLRFFFFLLYLLVIDGGGSHVEPIITWDA